MVTIIDEFTKLIEEAKKLISDNTFDYPDYFYYEGYPSYSNYKENNPCAHCINNPAINKFASGFCNCVLPYINNPIY